MSFWPVIGLLSARFGLCFVAFAHFRLLVARFLVLGGFGSFLVSFCLILSCFGLFLLTLVCSVSLLGLFCFFWCYFGSFKVSLWKTSQKETLNEPK